jgi:thioesterase domain-containing protein/acyl carrier protein
VQQLPHVRDAVVSSVPADDGGHRIVAHVVLDAFTGGEPVTVASLRRGLATRLPPYAIPRAFFQIKEVPQMLTGKVDRVGLRESAIGALPLETAFVEPRDARERQVARLFAEVLAVPRVGVLDDFFELGGDSLSAVDLLAGLDEEFGLELSASDLLRQATVEAVAARVADERTTLVRSVVQVNDGAGRPLFCVPGAADTPLQFRPLGRRLADVAVHAFAYRGIDHRAVPDLAISAIARRNVTAMRGVDPVGPYRLLGYSFGGAVALVMAQQLRDAGDEVELLALLEPTLWSARPWEPAEPGHFERVRERAISATPGRDAHARIGQLRMMGGAATRYVRRQAQTCTAGVVVRRGLAQHDVFMRLHGWLLRTHRLQPYGGRSVVLASPGYLELVRDVLDDVLPPESAGGRRTDVAVSGAHLDLVREPSVAGVARALDLVLAPERV